MIKLPKEIINQLRLHEGAQLDVSFSHNSVILKPTSSASYSSTMSSHEQKAYQNELNEAVGMIKTASTQGFDLMSFDAGDHIALFDDN